WYKRANRDLRIVSRTRLRRHHLMLEQPTEKGSVFTREDLTRSSSESDASFQKIGKQTKRYGKSSGRKVTKHNQAVERIIECMIPRVLQVVERGIQLLVASLQSQQVIQCKCSKRPETREFVPASDIRALSESGESDTSTLMDSEPTAPQVPVPETPIQFTHYRERSPSPESVSEFNPEPEISQLSFPEAFLEFFNMSAYPSGGPATRAPGDRQAFLEEARRINRRDLTVEKFTNAPAQDIQAFVDSISWKHGITRAEWDNMYTDSQNELDEMLLLYLYQKLDGEPARWWATLTKDAKINYKKVTTMLVARYGKDEARQKKNLRHRVANELNGLRQGNRSLGEYIAYAKDLHLRVTPEQETILIDNFINNLADEGFADMSVAGTPRRRWISSKLLIWLSI
ncbi:hypothetical protein GMDG_08620, partial [Pseudogymnoascus destructans 20631-21]